MIKGTGVALITPFNEDLSIDYLGLEKLINHQINEGIDYLVLMGTTGESAVLSKEDKSMDKLMHEIKHYINLINK